MPSINELFGNAANENDPFDMDAFLAQVDKEIETSNNRMYGSSNVSAAASDEGTEVPASSADATSEGTLVIEDANADAGGESADGTSRPPTATSGFSTAEMERLADLERQMEAIADAIPATDSASPTITETPLPDFITEHDRAQVEMFRRLQRLESEQAQRQQQSAEQARYQALYNAATRAINTFKNKYGDKLDQVDIEGLAQNVASSPMARIIQQGDPNVAESAFGDLLESTLWKHEQFRSKVLAANTEVPTEVEAAKEASAARKRVLSGLSAAAAPVGDVPAGSLSARPDGRLDEQSRKRLIATVVNQFRAASGGF